MEVGGYIGNMIK